jgi:RimJ/RimL family protein N-acetyltransferase
MILLQPFAESDFNQLINWASDETMLLQFAGPAFSFPLTPEQLAVTLTDPDRLCYRVLYVPANTIIGHAEIHFQENKTAHLCRILIGDETYRGKGLGLAIVQRLLAIGFAHDSVAEASLNVYDQNLAAISCYQKAGFAFHATHTRTRQVNNQTWTTLNMRIDRAKWQMLTIDKLPLF